MSSAWVLFRDKVEAIIGIAAKYVVPLLSVAAAALGVPAPVAAVLSAIPDLMGKLEVILPAKGSGPVRSDIVLSVMQVSMDAIEKQLTGGAATSFEKLKPLIQASMTNAVTAVTDLAPGIIAPASPLTPGESGA